MWWLPILAWKDNAHWLISPFSLLSGWLCVWLLATTNQMHDSNLEEWVRGKLCDDWERTESWWTELRWWLNGTFKQRVENKAINRSRQFDKSHYFPPLDDSCPIALGGEGVRECSVHILVIFWQLTALCVTFKMCLSSLLVVLHAIGLAILVSWKMKTWTITCVAFFVVQSSRYKDELVFS